MTLLVAGSLHLDVMVEAPHLPALDETVTGTDVRYVFGGKGGNQAVAAAKMGAKVSFAGRAGTDQFGDIIRETLERAGIDLSLLQRDPGPSGMSAAIVDARGEYGAVIVSAANQHIDGAQIEMPADTKLVLLQNEIPEAVNLRVAREAREMSAKVWLNAAPARELSAAMIDLVDLLIVNKVEVESYSALTNALEMLTTLGSQGVDYLGAHYPAFPTTIVSTHGAGDMFVGALAARVIAGESIAAALPFAQAAAALLVGATQAEREALSVEKVLRFIEVQDSL